MTLAALAGDPGSVPSPTWCFKTICNSSSRRSSALFWPLQAPDVQVVHRLACRQNIHTGQIKMKKYLRIKVSTCVSAAPGAVTWESLCVGHCQPLARILLITSFPITLMCAATVTVIVHGSLRLRNKFWQVSSLIWKTQTSGSMSFWRVDYLPLELSWCTAPNLFILPINRQLYSFDTSYLPLF